MNANKRRSYNQDNSRQHYDGRPQFNPEKRVRSTRKFLKAIDERLAASLNFKNSLMLWKFYFIKEHSGNLKDSISMSVIRRLPRYYRFLSELNDQNVDRISSTKLAQIMNVTASQVRQDLNCFGGFGQQGYGYSVSQLKDEIKNILGLNNDYKAILIGAGNLGKAVAMHMNFEKLGFELIACFDNNEKKVGQKLNDTM